MFNVHIARWIDTYAGLLACALLNAFRAVGRLRRPAESGRVVPSASSIKKILVIKFFGIGSIILSTPFLRSLRRAYPDTEIVFLTYQANRSLFDLYPVVNRVLTLTADRGILGFLMGVPRLFWRLRSERFDLVVDLEFFSYFTAIATYFTGCRLTLGYKSLKQMREPFYRVSISCDGSVHVSTLMLKFCDALGIPADGTNLEPPAIPASAREGLERKLETLGVKHTPILCININASPLAHSRRWPPNHFADVLGRASKNLACAIVLIGAKSDRQYVAAFLKDHPGLDVRDTSGVLSLPELAALLSTCRLFLTNDSGPLHLACALGVPTVSIFGPETPATYGPRGAIHTVFYANVFCSPCLNVYDAKTSNCTDQRCVKNIPPDAVYAAIEPHFDQRTPA